MQGIAYALSLMPAHLQSVNVIYARVISKHSIHQEVLCCGERGPKGTRTSLRKLSLMNIPSDSSSVI